MTRILGAIALLASAALGPRLDVSATPDELTIGDRAEIVISIRLSDGIPDGAVVWPQLESQLGDAEILEVGPIESSPLGNGDRRLARKLSVAFFKVGEALIPPIEVEVSTPSGPTVLSSEALHLTIRSVLPQTEEPPALKPPAPPRRLAIGERFWWTSGALLTTCLLALALLARQASAETAGAPSRPTLTPRQELERGLAALREERDTAVLHQGLSMTTRRYLGRVLEFPAPESTTSEVARELRRQRIDPEVGRHTERLLAECDMVMFARRDVALERSRERIEEAVAVADAVDAWLRPEALETDSAGGSDGDAR